MRGEQAVGCRVQVYWEGEDEWFDGVVDEYSVEKGYYVKYDDGEEQWELDAGEHSIRFLNEPESGRSEACREDQGENNESSSHADHEDYDEDEEGYEDDHDDEDPVEQEDDDNEAAIPDREDPVDHAAIPSTKPQKVVKPARVFMRTSAAFFRDEDTLREMQQELRQEKKTLTNQLHTLTMQLAEKEQVSAELKSELQQLKTSAALANVMRQVPRSTTLSSSPSGVIRGQSKPKTAAEWGERVLDQKLENQYLAEDLLALKTAVQDKQLAVQRKQKQRDDMSAKLARVPRRHLCTLVDLQVEIARLLEEKRGLETQSQRSPPRMEPEKLNGAKLGASTKTALQNELTSLEITAERYKEELRQCYLKIDCEKARLAPLEARLESLQQELHRYEDSHVLLRSVFLRLGPDSRDGCVALDAALTAFHTLTPLDRPELSSQDMLVRLKEGNIFSSDGLFDQQRVSFTQFVDAFGCLYKS